MEGMKLKYEPSQFMSWAEVKVHSLAPELVNNLNEVLGYIYGKYMEQ